MSTITIDGIHFKSSTTMPTNNNNASNNVLTFEISALTKLNEDNSYNDFISIDPEYFKIIKDPF